jgi:hypothetical protein
MDNIYRLLKEYPFYFTYQCIKGSLIVECNIVHSFQIVVMPSFQVRINFKDCPSILLNEGVFVFNLLDQLHLTMWLAYSIFRYDLRMHYRDIKQSWLNYGVAEYVIRTYHLKIMEIDNDTMAMQIIGCDKASIQFNKFFFHLFVSVYVEEYVEKKKEYLLKCIREIPSKKHKFDNGLKLLEVQKNAMVKMEKIKK